MVASAASKALPGDAHFARGGGGGRPCEGEEEPNIPFQRDVTRVCVCARSDRLPRKERIHWRLKRLKIHGRHPRRPVSLHSLTAGRGKKVCVCVCVIDTVRYGKRGGEGGFMVEADRHASRLEVARGRGASAKGRNNALITTASSIRGHEKRELQIQTSIA